MVGPRSAILARPALGMPMGETCTAACLSTSLSEVCCYNSPTHLKKLNCRNPWSVEENIASEAAFTRQTNVGQLVSANSKLVCV